MAPLIVDAGPLVALLDKNDTHHPWARQVMNAVTEPLVTCEAAVTEALYLLRRWELARRLLFGLLSDGLVRIPFRLEAEGDRIDKLMAAYRNVPMSLADACLVRLAETERRSAVWTLDRDFLIYRRNRSARIDLIAPWLD